MSGQKNVFGSFCLLIILPLVVFAAALAAYLGYLPLLMPKHTIAMLAIMLLFALFFAPQNEYCQGAKLLKNYHIFEAHLSELLKTRALKLGNKNKANASFDEFFDGFLRELKPLNFGNIASAVFPMLGILGTFISIAISMPDFTSRSTAALEREISELLGGIATAFYVSIYGIFLSIWWMFAARVGKGKIAAFYRRAKAYSMQYFWQPDELQTYYYEQTAAFNARTESVYKALLDSDFFTQLRSLHQEKFSLFSKLFQHYESMCSAQTELAERSLKLSAEALDSVKLEQEKFISQQKALIEEFSVSAEALNKRLESVSTCLDDERDFSSLDQLKTDITHINNETKDLLEKISQRE